MLYYYNAFETVVVRWLFFMALNSLNLLYESFSRITAENFTL